ncbi:hypothetical protein IGW_01199 [Bacillus cereus ISP3191]|nr:hypothetical protein IGW_01199 [Bacillus cereus ISP3191]
MHLEIEKVAEVLKNQSVMFTCSYKTAWENYMHPFITERFTFKEVITYINKN